MVGECLVPTERSRADRYYFDRDREAFVVGRAALRCLLGGILSISPAAVPIETGYYGKPQLTGGGPQFNVSHSGNFVLVALCATSQVGVDIEMLREGLDLNGVAPLVLTMEERRQVSSAPVSDRVRLFARYWCRKEAVTKAVGQGMFVSFREVEASCHDDSVTVGVRTACAVSGALLNVVDVPAPEGYVAAVAAETEFQINSFALLHPG